MSLKEKIQHKYALSEQGAKDMIKAFVSVTISDIVLMFPVGMLYSLVKDYMGETLSGRGAFYLAGSMICLALIAVTTYIQYNATFFATYVESGVRRITLAEKLRKIPPLHHSNPPASPAYPQYYQSPHQSQSYDTP